MCLTVKATVSYIGTSYFGFQKQPNNSTIGGELEKVFSILFKSPIRLISAGRTDRGVHALGQVVSANVPFFIKPDNLKVACNSLLPSDIRIESLQYVQNHFHPIKSAVSRCYDYYISNHQLPIYLSPFIISYSFNQLELIKEALPLFEGTHLFSAFSTRNDSLKPGPRCLYEASLKNMKSYCLFNTTIPLKVYRFRFVANAFLYHMIRHIVGSLIYLDSGHLTLNDISFMLKKNKKIKSWPLADPKALWLTKVIYNTEEFNEV